MHTSIPHPAEIMLLAPLSDDIKQRASKVKLMVFDVDGVLTNGTLWYSDQGEVFKGFHAHDGHGIKLLRESGIEVALMTGRDSGAVSRRAADLGISNVAQGVKDKGQSILELTQQLNLDLNQVGFMGDDLIDIPAMRKVGFSASVYTAPSYIRQAAHWVSKLEPGTGAARECCDLILASQHKLGRFIQSGSSNFITPGVAQ